MNPVAINIVGIDPPTVYVANYDSNSVSVINTTTHSKIGEDIPVGDNPRAMALAVNLNVDTYSDTLYVSNFGSNSVSVINTTTHSKIGEDIPVGDEPVDITFDSYSGGAAYVANLGSNSVSVINTTTHSKIGEDIPVGDGPAVIDFLGGQHT